MSRNKKNRKNLAKPKHLTAAMQRRGSWITPVNVDLTSMPAYKTPAPRRHRGPVTASAVPGVGSKGAIRRARSGK